MSRVRSPRGRRRLGAAMIEFALVLPLFASTLLGIFEFGRAFMVYQVVVNSSRVAARKAVIANTSASDVEAAAKDQVRISGLPQDQFTVSYKVNGATAALSTAKRGDAVTVRVSIPFDNIAVVSPLFLGGVTLGGETVMRSE